MTRPLDIRGYAIVSADDRIADHEGRMPPALMNEADWAYFQAELDRCDLVALGRASHEAAPNTRSRRRLVVSRSAPGLVERPDAWWWNPADLAWADVAARLLPSGGRVGVPGGQGAFDLFAAIGFSAFHLSRAERVRLPGGRGLFSRVEGGESAEAIFADLGLAPSLTVPIDPAAGITLTIWRAVPRP
jgi:hypothetical protein